MSDPLHPSRIGLHPSTYWILPELETLRLPVESRSTCDHCAMLPPDGDESDDPQYFHPDARCCTYHPLLPNYSIGLILKRGGQGAMLIRHRLENPEGVDPWGIERPDSWGTPYEVQQDSLFGREPSLTCPYWVGGEHACGIWEDRNSVCRTWHCRYVDGHRGTALWVSVRNLLRWVEIHLGSWLAAHGAPPPPSSPVDAWVAWFIDCADRLDAVSPMDLTALRDDELSTAVLEMFRYDQERSAPIPDVLVPNITGMATLGDRVRITGLQYYDPVEVDPLIFRFIAKCDGERGWRELLAETEAELGHSLGEPLIRWLYLMGALLEPAQHQVESESGEEPSGLDLLALCARS